MNETLALPVYLLDEASKGCCHLSISDIRVFLGSDRSSEITHIKHDYSISGLSTDSASLNVSENRRHYRS